MILKAAQRGGARALAKHLLNERDNDHVEVHEVRGFLSDTLDGALLEVEATAKGTRCKQYLFSVSLSPPPDENVRPEVFELAAQRIESELGLSGQPRALVFHEKEGRRHAHCVWSRIDAENMRSINLSFFKRRVNELSRQLFIEHGWELPKGYRQKQERNPLNFTLDEWQQARRAGKNAADIKATFQECWNLAKDRKQLQALLEERGYFLARGDRRGFVAVDFQGEVYALGRMTGAKAKALRDRLGSPEDLPSACDAKARISAVYERTLKRHVVALNERTEERLQPVRQRKTELNLQHKAARRSLRAQHQARWTREAAARQARFSKGLRGVWDWLRGHHRALRKRHEMEIVFARDRDRSEYQALVQSQITQRRELQQEVRGIKREHKSTLEMLYRDLARTQQVARSPESTPRVGDARRSRGRTPERSSSAGRSRSRERMPEP